MPAGVVLPFWLDRPPGEAVEVTANAAQVGYPEIWMGEMLHFDAFALAGAVAASTERATITVGPLAVDLRDPVAMATGVASTRCSAVAPPGWLSAPPVPRWSIDGTDAPGPGRPPRSRKPSF